MWPTHIDLLFTDSTGDTSLLRVTREAQSDVYTGDLDGVTYTISRTAGTFSIDDGTAVVAVLGDDFWLQGEHLATFATGAGTITISDYSVDWLNPQIAWIPIFIGFMTGMVFDVVTVGPFLVLRVIGQGVIGVSRMRSLR
jgi:hypothetical protein